jgi:hypothetical protein
MRKVVVFDHVTLDGFFTDPSGDMSFAHRKEVESDPEWREFTDKKRERRRRAALRPRDVRDDGRLVAVSRGEAGHARGREENE